MEVEIHGLERKLDIVSIFAAIDRGDLVLGLLGEFQLLAVNGS